VADRLDVPRLAGSPLAIALRNVQEAGAGRAAELIMISTWYRDAQENDARVIPRRANYSAAILHIMKIVAREAGCRCSRT
jgi:hypothetical protein